MTGPIGDGYGTREGCRTGCLIAVISALVVGVLFAAVAVGVSAVMNNPSPTSSTSTRSTP